jgi:hypothetical protein
VSRAAFQKAERRRRTERPATKGQRHMLKRLSAQAGIEPPVVRWHGEARDAIRRLKRYIAQPMLDGWREASVV